MQTGIEVNFGEPQHVGEDLIERAFATLHANQQGIRRLRANVGVEARNISRGPKESFGIREQKNRTTDHRIFAGPEEFEAVSGVGDLNADDPGFRWRACRKALPFVVVK